jgi:hypothetical protein
MKGQRVKNQILSVMKQTLTNYKARIVAGVACSIIGAICWGGGSTCRAQAPANLSPGLQEVVKLSKAQMGDDVIVGYINKSGTTFHLTADDIVYLKDQGVSQPVIAALLQPQVAAPAPAANPAPAPAPQPVPSPQFAPAPQAAPAAVVQQPGPPPGAPAPEVNFNYFHDQLAPFGAWINVGGTLYWRPDSALRANPDWRPYYDMGHWTQTDNGLFWQSDYAWGDIPFHYGRWVRDPVLGWLWAPDYTWGPAWVFWRHAEADGAIGWAPLPVGAVFVEGGFMYRGARVGVDFDFGLGEGVFVFVGYDHFHEGFFRLRGREYAWHIHGDRFHDFYRRSVLRNEFRRDEHGRFINGGIGRDRMERATHGRVEHAAFQERHPVGDRASLAHPSEKAGEKASGKTASAGPSKVFRPPAPAEKAAPALKQPSKK